MGVNRTLIVVILLFYLSAMFFLLGAMSEDITINMTTTSQSIGTEVSFLGMTFSLGENFLSNIVVSVANLPIWFNTLFIVMPSILLAVFTIMMFIPTIPSG